MDLHTIGQKFNIGYDLELWHTLRESFEPEQGYGERFRLIYVMEGTGIIRLGERRGSFLAPVLFCLNEKERPILEQAVEVKAQSLYFHPSVINSAFTFENIRGDISGFSQTEYQDVHWVEPFIRRDARYGGELTIGPSTAPRINALFQRVSDELHQERDNFWPCRSRSLFLELLFIIYSFFQAPDTVGGEFPVGRGRGD